MKQYKGQDIYPSKEEIKEGIKKIRKNITIERGLSAAEALGRKARKRHGRSTR